MSFNWGGGNIDDVSSEEAVTFVMNVRLRVELLQPSNNPAPLSSSLSTKQHHAFEIVLNHSLHIRENDPIKMIIQGTAGIGKSFLIHFLSHHLSSSA